MKKLLLALSMVFAVLLVSAPATASFDQNIIAKEVKSDGPSLWKALFDKANKKKMKKSKKKMKDKFKKKKPAKSVPEIDAGQAGLVFAFLASMFAFIRERKLK